MHQLVAQTLLLTRTWEITQQADVSISAHKARLMKWGVVAAISHFRNLNYRDEIFQSMTATVETLIADLISYRWEHYQVVPALKKIKIKRYSP